MLDNELAAQQRMRIRRLFGGSRDSRQISGKQGPERTGGGKGPSISRGMIRLGERKESSRKESQVRLRRAKGLESQGAMENQRG